MTEYSLRKSLYKFFPKCLEDVIIKYVGIDTLYIENTPLLIGQSDELILNEYVIKKTFFNDNHFIFKQRRKAIVKYINKLVSMFGPTLGEYDIDEDNVVKHILHNKLPLELSRQQKRVIRNIYTC